MKQILLFVAVLFGITASAFLVDAIGHPWILGGDLLPVAVAMIFVVPIPWIIKSREVPLTLVMLAYITYSAGFPNVLINKKPAVQYGFRLVGALLTCATASLFLWLAEILFSEPLKVLDDWAVWFPSHTWSWGTTSFAFAALLVTNLVPTLRAPITR